MLQFRRPRHPDIQTLCYLRIRAGQEKNDDTYSSDDERQGIWECLCENMTEILQDKNYKVIVAKDRDITLGYALYHIRPNNQGTGTHMIEVDDLYSIGSKKQRVGEKLLKKMCLMESNISHITLKTMARSDEFYRKMGFIQTDPESSYVHLYGANLQKLRQVGGYA